MTTDLLAILVSDLVDSTATRARIGEERADDLQHVHDRTLRDAVEAARGDVVKGTGDGVVATFPSATDALAAAVAIQQQMDAYSRDPRAIAAIELRVGIAVGDVVHQDGDIFGSAVVEAARLCAAAGGGDIYCSDLVRTLARGRGGYEFDLIGLLELKGLPDPVATCVVRWDRVSMTSVAALGLPEDLDASSALQFVGRAEVVQEAVASALAVEQPHVTWVLGEPGVGKSRFAAEVSARVLDAGALVLFGRCDELVQDPFQPFIQGLRWFVDHLGDDELRAALGADPAPLMRLVPEIGARIPGLGQDVGRTTELEQYRLLESVRAWMAITARDRAVVFVLDDVHWADRPTLAMLAHLVRGAAPMRLTFLATSRDTDPDVSDALTDLIDDLARTGRSATTKLKGLGVDDVAALVSSAGIVDTGSDLAARLAEETAGNPLFIGAVLAGLGDASAERALPADVRSAVRRRVRGLDPRGLDVLQVAALVGQEFSLALTADASGSAESVCLDTIEHAVSAGLIDEVGVDRFRFTHALVRDAMMAELSVSRRARLHGAIAEAIERRYRENLGEHLRSLAHHCSVAHTDALIARSIAYARESADRAMNQLAFEAAADDLTLAIDVAERLGRPEELRAELLVARGELQMMAARHTAALESFAAAAELARARNDWNAFANAAIDYEEASWRPGFLGHGAIALLREAVQHELDPLVHVAARGSLARALRFAGEPEASHRMAEEVLREAQAINDPQLLSHAIAVYLESLPQDGIHHYDEVAHLSLDALALVDRGAKPTSTVMAMAWSVYREMTIGNYEAARGWRKLFEEHAERSGLRFDRYLAMAYDQILTFCEGDMDSAERQADALLDFGQQLGEDVSGTHGVQLFLIRREQGRLGEIAPIVRTMLRLNPASAMWRPGLIALLADATMEEEARPLLAEFATDDFVEMPRDGMFGAALCLLGDAAAKIGATEVGRVIERLLLPWAGGCIWIGTTVGILGASNRYLGLLAALDGRLDEADRWLQDGLVINRRVHATVWEAHTLADLAEVRTRLGDWNAGRAYATEARLLAERHGLVAVTRQLDRIAAE